MIKEVEKWNNRYKKYQLVYGNEPNVFLKEKITKLPRNQKILCVAEGEGRNAVFLAKQGNEVTAWDFSQEGLNKMDIFAKFNEVSVTAECVDLTKAIWTYEEWDSVVNIYGHFHKGDRDSIFNGIKKSIKIGGYFISEVYSNEQIKYKTGGPSKNELLYSPEEVLLFFKGWKVIEFFVGEVYRKEGQMHQGKCHVIQTVFQKIAPEES